jgi:hypothetical protein
MNAYKNVYRCFSVIVILAGSIIFNACVPTPTTGAPTAAQIFTSPKSGSHFTGSTASIRLSALDAVTVCYTTINAKLFIFNGICRASGTYGDEIALSCPRGKTSPNTLVKVNLLFEWPAAVSTDPPTLEKRSASYWLNCSDADGDGVPAISDNCPDISNPGQIDTNNDGVGDSCDFVTSHCPVVSI